MKTAATAKVTTTDGLTLHTNTWLADTAEANIYFLHGFFEHSGRYAYEAEYFNKEGFNFYAYDQRTHGLSGGKHRSFIASFENYVVDFETFLSHRLVLDKPYFLMSHSMGGLVLCSYLLKHKALSPNFKGVIMSAPLLAPDKDTAPLLQKVSGIVGTLAPKLKTIGIDPNAVSRKPEEVQKYIDDPLNYTDKLYAGSGYQLLKQMKKVQAQLTHFTHPFLVLHGTDDKLAEIEGSKMLYSQSTSADKEFIELQDYKHEITKDLGKEKVLSAMSMWMKNRL